MMTIAIALLMLSAISLYAQRRPDCRCNADCQCANGCQCQLNAGKSCSCRHNQGHRHIVSGNIFLQMMDTMMVDMDAVPLGASLERNFLRQMIPHHQGAVDMAKYEIEHGKNLEMIQLAKSILTEQQGEIMEMEALLKQYPSPEDTKPIAGYVEAMNQTMEKMMKKTPTNTDLKGMDTDCAFAMVMLPHHQAALDMAMAYLRFNGQGTVAIYARKIISDQQIEIEQMQQYIKQHCKPSPA